MQKMMWGSLLGISLGLAGMLTYDLTRFMARSTPPSVVAEAKPLTSFQVDPTWVLSGTPNFRATETTRSPDGRTITGLWACDGPTRFEWTFGLDETVHLLEGRVEVEYLGRKFTLLPGSVATFHAGTKAIWTVPEHAKKSYTLHHPGRLGLLMRRLFPVEADELDAAASPASPRTQSLAVR